MNKTLQGIAVGATTLALATSICVPTGIYSFTCGATKAYADQSESAAGMLDGTYQVVGLSVDSKDLKLDEGLKLASPSLSIKDGTATLTFTTGTYAFDRIAFEAPEKITEKTKTTLGSALFKDKDVAKAKKAERAEAEKAAKAAGEKVADPVYAKSEVTGVTFTLTLSSEQLAALTTSDGVALTMRYNAGFEKSELAGTWAKTRVHLTASELIRNPDPESEVQAEPAAAPQASAVAPAEEPTSTGGDTTPSTPATGEGEGGGTGGTTTPTTPSTPGTGEGEGGEGGNGGETQEPETPAINLEATKVLIEKLPALEKVKTTDKAAIEEAQSAVKGLSAEDQAALTSAACGDTGFTYARYLERAVAGLAAASPVDDSTTLADGTYNSVGTRPLKADFTQPQDAPDAHWSVTEVVVADGKAQAKISVDNPDFAYVIVNGKTYESETAKDAAATTSEFTIPIDLNSTMAIVANSVMPVSTFVDYSLKTTIKERTAEEVVKDLIDALPTDPYEYTKDLADEVKKAEDALAALPAESQDAVKKAMSSEAGEITYERLLEVAQWSLKSLEPVDNATKLADGTYSGGKVTGKSDMGTSTSARQRTWSVESVTVKDGKATARIVWSGNTPLEDLHVGDKAYPNLGEGSQSIFEIPVDLNGDMYFSVKFKNATEATDAIAYHFVATCDEENTQPDPVPEPTPEPAPEDPEPEPTPTPAPAPTDGGSSSGGSSSGSSSYSPSSTTPTTTTTTRTTTTKSTSSTSGTVVSRGTVTRTTSTKSTLSSAAKTTVPGSTNANSNVGKAQTTLNRDLRAATAGNIETTDIVQASSLVQPDRTPLAVLLSLIAAAAAGAATFLTRFFRAER